jgi:thiamine biosynthesis lipoprotein
MSIPTTWPRLIRPAISVLVLSALCIATPARAEWVYRDEAIMGTRNAVEVWAPNRLVGEVAINAVFEDMRRIDRLMSTYKATSEISKVNREAAQHPVKVSAELFSLLEKAQEYAKLSGGVFDITYASVGYLFDYRKHLRPDTDAIDKALPTVDYRQLKLDPVNRTVSFGMPGMRIDLGGIAKGYAVDRGIEILKRRGYTHAMVNSGGDTRVLGDRMGKPWMVGIRHPDRKEEVVLRIPLEDAAFSTSGDYERFFDEGGVRYHHIINPKTGDSPREVRSVTLISSSALRTDGLTKTVFILGPVAGMKFIDSLPDVDGIIIAADGKVSYSKGLQPPE